MYLAAAAGSAPSSQNYGFSAESGSSQGTPAHAHGAGTELVVLGLVGGQGVALGRGWVSEAGCAPPGHGVLVRRAEGREGRRGAKEGG